jgi:hypothetical protein
MPEVNLILGRILMDEGFKNLFQHDPVRAGAAIGLKLEPTTIARVHDLLARMDAMDATARILFSSRLSSLERSVQK